MLLVPIATAESATPTRPSVRRVEMVTTSPTEHVPSVRVALHAFPALTVPLALSVLPEHILTRLL